MYIPSAFDASADWPRWIPALLDRDPFISLVSLRDGRPEISHLPVLLHQPAEGPPVLLGHWARRNPQWQGLHAQQATAIVHGPHAYISPRGYPSPRQAVPTWNYVVAHLHGHIELVEGEELVALLARLSERFEPAAPAGWTLAQADPAMRALHTAVVGFRLPLERVELAMKLNQHHPQAKRRSTIEALQAEPSSAAAEIAAWMQLVEA